LQWNARYLYREKLQAFKNDLHVYDPTVVILCETNWKDDYMASFTAYQSFTLNRIGRDGGGVAILVKKTLQSDRLIVPPTPHIEAVRVSIQLEANRRIEVVSAYCPHGDCEDDEIRDLFDCTEGESIIAGDFNGHSDLWEDGKVTNRCGRGIIGYLENNDKFNLITPKNLKTYMSRTGGYSTLDLTFVSPSLELASTIDLGPVDWGSDHFPVITTIDANPEYRSRLFPNWHFSDKKWTAWNEDIRMDLSAANLNDIHHPLTAYSTLQEALIRASEFHFKPKRSKNPKEKIRPGWTRACQDAVSNARAARRMWMENPLSPVLKTELNRLEAIKKRTIRQSFDESWESHIASFEKDRKLKKFWSFTRQMVHGKQPIQDPVLFENGTQVRSPRRLAQIFLDEYVPPTDNGPQILDRRTAMYEEKIHEAISDDSDCDLSTPFTRQELEWGLRKLEDKAMGPDRIHNRMLTHLSSTNKEAVLRVFNLLFRSGTVPEEWKEAHIVPILKPNKPRNEASSYRPISLTSCMAKLLEKLINYRLRWFCERNKVFPTQQAGFRSGHTTMDHIIRLEGDGMHAINLEKFAAAVFLDLKNAYPETWITGLLYKLSKINVRGCMLKWLSNFLSGRTARVLVANCLSETRQLKKGVPQGCVLSPILFNIFMRDFPLPRSGVELSLFADDIEFHTESRSPGAAFETLQAYLYRIENWARFWKMVFSINKCASLLITRKRKFDPPPPLQLANSPIQMVDEVRFLGMIFNSVLKWNNHISKLSTSLNRSLSLFRALTAPKINLSTQQLIRIYKAIIRSKIDYGAVVLASSPESHYAPLNVAQNNILRLISGALKSTPICLMNIETDIAPVQDRWEFLASQYLIKLNGRKSNIAYNSVKKHLDAQCDWRPKSTPAAIPLVRAMRNMDRNCFRAEPSDSPIVPLSPPWGRPVFTSSFFPMSKRRASQSPQEARALFSSLYSNSDPRHLNIYTDASVDPVDKSAACALFIPGLNLQKSWSICKGASILTAELLGIAQAIRTVYEMDLDSFSIFTDSKSSIDCLKSPTTENSLAWDIKDMFSNCNSAGMNPSLIWIPSHIGIPGNTIADELASSGRLHPTEGQLEYHLSAQEFSVIYKHQWKKRLLAHLKSINSMTAVSTRITMGPYPWHINKNRRLQSCLFRLRSGHNKLNKCASKWSPEVDKYCLFGCAPATPEEEPPAEDAYHVIMECQEYSAQRRLLEATFNEIGQPFTLSSALGLTHTDVIPSHDQLKIQKALCQFLIDTGLIERV